MVGVTGLEPATSRPPAVRATNCATPRFCDVISRGLHERFDIPCTVQGGYSQSTSTEAGHLEFPIKIVIKENHIRLGNPQDLSIISLVKQIRRYRIHERIALQRTGLPWT